MKKLITAASLIAICGCFASPLSTAEAAGHHHRHHGGAKGHHRHRHHRSGSSSPLAWYNDNKEGLASWYGRPFHGRRTANGERYDMYAMTAAHRTLPLSSYVEVTNLRNNRSVIVRINDRGPYHGKRIMDLSYAAAKELGIQQAGTGNIKITPLGTETSIAQAQAPAESTTSNTTLPVYRYEPYGL
jgi:rare lipoprotein A